MKDETQELLKAANDAIDQSQKSGYNDNGVATSLQAIAIYVRLIYEQAEKVRTHGCDPHWPMGQGRGADDMEFKG